MSAPIYYVGYPTGSAALTAADAADYDGSGTLVTVYTGVSGVTDVLSVIIAPKTSTQAGNVIRFFKDDGTRKVWVGDFVVPQVTLTPTGHWRDPWVWYPPGGPLPLTGTGELLKASQEKNDTINLLAKCGAYQ